MYQMIVVIPHITEARRDEMYVAFPELEVLGATPIVESNSAAIRVAKERIEKDLAPREYIENISLRRNDDDDYVVSLGLKVSAELS